ncbi:unnamed protein product [Symbiodinium microadriaticum]|nr:unnamed protein product [Symbiodinium microadriaticum]
MPCLLVRSHLSTSNNISTSLAERNLDRLCFLAMAYAWPDAYGNKGWGKRKGWGTQSKGKKGSHKGDWWDDAQQEDRPQEDAHTHTGRIWARYQFPKAILKASAGQDGSAFVKDSKRSASDDVFLAAKSLKSLLTPDSTHLLRRPGVGVSEAAGSIQAGADVLGSLPDIELDVLAGIFQEPELQGALAQLNTVDSSVQHDSKDVRAAVAVVFDVLSRTPRLKELAQKLTIASSRLYLMGTALLPLLLCAEDPAWWVSQIPEGVSDSASVRDWRKKGKDETKMQKAIAAMLCEKLDEDHERGRGNNASALFTKKDTRRRASPAGSTDGSKAEKKQKKKSKKDDPSESTEQRTAGKKHKPPAPGSHPKKLGRRPADAVAVLQIHRINAIAADGRAVVKEDTPVDEVALDEAEETVAAAVARLMEAQGSLSDAPNWEIRAMNDDFILREMQPDVTLARNCTKVALVRKGG